MGHPENLAWSDLMDDMQAGGGEALQSAVGRFARRLGFGWFAYVSRSAEGTRVASDDPEAWRRLYAARDYARIDPVVAEAGKGSTPFAWDGANPAIRRGRESFFSAAAEFGIRAGVTVPVAGGYGQLAFMTFAAGDGAGPARAENLPLLTLAALHFHVRQAGMAAAARLRNGDGRPLLTRRERLCLTWAARGKTAGETATILSVHEATVRYHLNNARQRLAAATLPQAVAVALRRGEIE